MEPTVYTRIQSGHIATTSGPRVNVLRRFYFGTEIAYKPTSLDVRIHRCLANAFNLDNDRSFRQRWCYSICADGWKYLASLHLLLGPDSVAAACLPDRSFSGQPFLNHCEKETRCRCRQLLRSLRQAVDSHN